MVLVEALNAILTLALASTWAPFLRSILIISVWFALAAKCNGVSPLTVGISGLASCCSKYITIFIHPIKLATCNGVNPDYKKIYIVNFTIIAVDIVSNVERENQEFHTSVVASMLALCFRRSSTTFILFFLHAI